MGLIVNAYKSSFYIPPHNLYNTHGQADLECTSADIRLEILMHLRALKKVKKDVSLHDPIGTDKEGNEITLIDVLQADTADVVDTIQLKMEKKQVYEYIHILDDREKEVIIGRFGLDLMKEKTQREIAKELGISRSYVSRIEKRALMKLFHEFYKQSQKKKLN